MKREIEHVLVVLNDTTRTAIRMRSLKTVERLPTATYDGLLSSATVSKLDASLQEGLYRFYTLFRDKPTHELSASDEEILRAEAVRMSDMLDRYIRRKKSVLKFF